MSHRQIVTAALLAIVALAAGMLLARALMPGAPAQLELAQATVLEPPRPLPQFELIDQHGKPFGPERLRGHWSLLFFGFTNCPDVCPMTLSVLAQAEKQLADLPADQRPRVVLVSVDPKRDTPAKLDTYVRFFSPDFLGVTGTQEAMDRFTQDMGVPVAISPISEDHYNVDHSAAIFLIEPEGALRALYSTPHTPETIAADYRRIVAAYGN